MIAISENLPFENFSPKIMLDLGVRHIICKSEVSHLKARCLILVVYLWGAYINGLDHTPVVGFLWSKTDI